MDLCDSLSIQLDSLYKESPHYDNALKIVNHLKKVDVTQYSKFDTVIAELNQEANFDTSALNIIRKLNPKPGLEVSKKLDSYHISPEVIIFKRDGKWVTELTKK